MASKPDKPLSLRGKYRGCMLGILIGDCLGKPFVGSGLCVDAVQGYFNILDDPSQDIEQNLYSCNTAFTKYVARYVISQLEEYWKDAASGHTKDLVRVLHELWSGKFKTFYDPSRKSYFVATKNASAIAVAPIALLLKSNYKEMHIDATRLAALPHRLKLTVHGALMHCIAIRQCINLHPREEVVHTVYIDKLIEKLKFIAVQIPGIIPDPTIYHTKLGDISQILTDELTDGNYRPIGSNEFLRGIGATALQAVHSAIYCYLRAQRPIEEIKTDNPFTRSIQLAISCGRDANCIAALVGCLAGAHYGETIITQQLRSHCESVSDIIKIADALVKLYI